MWLLWGSMDGGKLVICMKCGTLLETIERWCRVCGTAQDYRDEEAPENVSEYRRMLQELMQGGNLADWQEVELQRLRRRMGVREGTHQRLVSEIAQEQNIPIEAFVDAKPLAALKTGLPAIARLRIINVAEPTFFVQAAYAVSTGRGMQMTAAAQPLEEMEGTQLQLEFTPEEFGHHHLEIVISISEQEEGPYRQLMLTPVRLQVGRQTLAGAPVIDLGQGEVREAEWIGDEDSEDWRKIGVEWADANALSSFQTRHAEPEEGSVEASLPTGSVEDPNNLAAERRARAQAARTEAQRVAEVDRHRQEQVTENYKQASRGRMESWAQAEFWGRHERDQARRKERLEGLLKWAESVGVRFTDIPQPVSNEWLQWAEKRVMENVQKSGD
jgi:hypothetical protein